ASRAYAFHVVFVHRNANLFARISKSICRPVVAAVSSYQHALGLPDAHRVGDSTQVGIVKGSDHRLRILQVATSDLSGGAERSAVNLHHAFRARGNDSWLAVGSKTNADPDVFEISNEQQRNAWVRWWTHVRKD